MHNRLWRAALLSLVFVGQQAAALSVDDARHLALRAGFGLDKAAWHALQKKNRGQAVSYLLAAKPLVSPKPDCVAESNPPQAHIKGLTQQQRMVFNQSLRACNKALKTRYFNALVHGQAVLPARMTLFWHNHFTTSSDKVPRTELIRRQHGLLARNALGNFRVLLHGILHDAAMLMYLDNVNNNKWKPNENLARELLELFALGEGHYTEQDIKATARALTGLSIEREGFRSHFYVQRHDFGKKNVLGEVGYFGPDALAEVILSKPQTARFISRKLWLEFVSEPDEKAIAGLADQFYKDWNIRRLVRGILMSPSFWADKGKMIKSPVELMVGVGRLLPRRIPDKSVVWQLKAMGQDLFAPPNVKGWPTGHDWINSSSMMMRVTFGRRVLRGLQASKYKQELAYLCVNGGPARLAALPMEDLDDSLDDEGPEGVADNSDSKVKACLKQLSQVFGNPVWQLK